MSKNKALQIEETISTSENSNIGERFLLQNEDIKDDFNESSLVPSEQDKESLDDSFIQELSLILEEIKKKDEFVFSSKKEEEKSIAFLRKKRNTKSPNLDSHSSDEE